MAAPPLPLRLLLSIALEELPGDWVEAEVAGLLLIERLEALGVVFDIGQEQQLHADPE